MVEIEELFRENNINFIPSGRDYLIHCLNPEHPDRNPSLRIDKLTGVGHCFSCGFPVNIFQYFGAYSDLKLAKALKLKEKMNLYRSQTIGIDIPPKAVPFTSSYRGISGATYRHFQAFTFKEFGNRVVFPIKDSTGRIVAFNGRAMSESETPKYKIHPEGVRLPTFPGRITPYKGAIILVEGIFDLLNLYDKGITNVVALLGVSTLYSKKGLNKEKTDLFKLAGASKIYLILDGDEAGRKATQELKPLLEADGFIVDIVELEDGQDPGSMSLEDITTLIEYMKE